MWTTVIKLAIQVLAGVGLGELADIFVKPKYEPYPAPVSPGVSNIPKLIWFVGIFVLAGVILKYIGRKMRISILK